MTTVGRFADLHLHSTFSDGTEDPEAVVELAALAGVRALALSDHDTTAGSRRAAAACERHGIEAITAVEINTDVPDAEVHILGYWIDEELAWFQRLLARRRAARRERGRAIVARLMEIGLTVPYEHVERLAAGGVIARPHIARAMVELRMVRDEAEAYERYLGVGRPAYVVRDPLTPTDAIRAVHEAGGTAVLAHPAWFAIDHLIGGLVAAGLDGIECYYAEHSEAQTAYFAEIARSFGLAVSVGSDFHGPGSKKPYAPGSVAGPDDAVEQLRSRRPAVMERTS